MRSIVVWCNSDQPKKKSYFLLRFSSIPRRTTVSFGPKIAQAVSYKLQKTPGCVRQLPPMIYRKFSNRSLHFFLLEIFTLIIFRLWSISLIMTSRAEITTSLKMHFFDQKCIMGDSAVYRPLYTRLLQNRF